jgi:hypothetical protein
MLDVRPLIKRAKRDDVNIPLLIKVDRWQKDDFKKDIIRILIKHVKFLASSELKLRVADLYAQGEPG